MTVEVAAAAAVCVCVCGGDVGLWIDEFYVNIYSMFDEMMM